MERLFYLVSPKIV